MAREPESSIDDRATGGFLDGLSRARVFHSNVIAVGVGNLIVKMGDDHLALIREGKPERGEPLRQPVEVFRLADGVGHVAVLVEIEFVVERHVVKRHQAILLGGRAVARPKQVGAVQTCRGSHTHTLVPHPTDKGVVYLYVSGSQGAREYIRHPGAVAIVALFFVGRAVVVDLTGDGVPQVWDKVLAHRASLGEEGCRNGVVAASAGNLPLSRSKDAIIICTCCLVAWP